MKHAIFAASVLLLALAPVSRADEPATQEDARALSEHLIYSVNRVPERTFDTARAVEVITREEIWRKNATSLSDILSDETGFVKYRTSSSNAAPVVRGLLGRQVLVLIDGVKVNNALYGDTPNLDLIDISQIERIEIVRGAVSVFGTESLGGVINIITRKGSSTSGNFGASLGMQYSSAAEAFSTPFQVYGQSEKMRWIVGANYQSFGEMRGGEGVGTQRFTDYSQRSAHLGFDYFVSTEKTLTFSYRGSEQDDVRTNSTLVSGSALRADTTPIDLQLATLAYQDLTDRGWAQSIRATGYWNRQSTGSIGISRTTPDLQTTFNERDTLLGLNVELGSFFGKHHLVYGADATRDAVDSSREDLTLSTGAIRNVRGRYTDGTTYDTVGVYVQDHVKLTNRLTASAGLRYGFFRTSGSETLPSGPVDLDSTKSDLTGAVNLIFHATSNFNIIGNVMRGFRAPNLRDVSAASFSATTATIPNPNADAEEMISYEGGVKFENELLSASAFYFHNSLSNLLVVTASTWNGLSFIDFNGNGTRDAGEPTVRQNRNLGDATIDGYELELAVRPATWLSLFANYTSTSGETDDTDQVAFVQRVPPPYGALGVKTSFRGRFSPWAEAIYSFNQPYESNGVELTPASDEVKLRAGFNPTDWLRIAVSGENLTNERYIPRFTNTAHPGRRFVLTTEFRF
ncbi:MAG TPA: TonB-dependent receptor [Thermoanaerobaculia bacterium]